MNTLEVKIGDGAYVSVNVPLVNVVNANVPVGSKSNFVSYVEEQNKTEEEKALARENLGLTDEMLAALGSNVRFYTTTFTNIGKQSSLIIPKETHNCGTQLSIKCKTNGCDIIIDTRTDESGNVYVNWGKSNLVNINNPITIYIYGIVADANYNNNQNNDNQDDNNQDNEQPIEESDNKVNVKVTLKDFASKIIGIIEQKFNVNSNVTLSDFNDWSNYSDKYDINNTPIYIGDENLETTIYLSGKTFTFNCVFYVNLGDNEQLIVRKSLTNQRYNTAVLIENVGFYNYKIGADMIISDTTIQDYELQPDTGVFQNFTYIMNDDYVDNITLICHTSL